MLIDEQLVQLLRPCKNFNVLHVGAHIGEEAAFYRRVGAKRTYWVEAQPDLCTHMRRSLDPARHEVYEGVAWSQSGVDLTFHVTNNVQSSSVFALKEHLRWHPEVEEIRSHTVTTVRLDELVPVIPYLLVNLDIQGAELHALKGMGKLLDHTQVVYSEVNSAETYEGIDQVDELDGWLAAQGFRREFATWVPDAGWGDAIYVRNRSVVNAVASVSRLATAGKNALRPAKSFIRGALQQTHRRRD